MFTCKMFPLKWSIWCVLLTIRTSTCFLDRDKVICSQGLSNCTIEDEMPLTKGKNHADVQNLTPYFKLCCKDRGPCKLCLVIDIDVDIDINIHLHEVFEDEDPSGLDEKDYNEEMRSPKVSVTVCYKEVNAMPACKKVEFTVNHAAPTQKKTAKISLVIIEPTGVSFSSKVSVYSFEQPRQIGEVDAPSVDEVCSQEQQDRVKECDVPIPQYKINHKTKCLELQFPGRNKSLPSMCVQYEQNGKCQRWSSPTIPLYSVTSCMCFQVWDEDGQTSRRSKFCPFNNRRENSEDFFQKNVWDNVSVSVGQGQMNNNHTMLLWNLSAPCRLEGEVWPCLRESSCREMKGFRQQLATGTWKRNSKGHWEKKGVFEDIHLELSPCVMVKIKGMGSELGPICFKNTDRWRWSLLVVGVMLLICFAVLIFYLLHGFVKKWVWSWHHGRFLEIGRKRHVVVLSPPDVDDGVSESVSQLGYLLCKQGFSVCVDQWSRKEQCARGPLPWLHSHLLELKNVGGRVVLVLTRKALERAEEWTHRQTEAIKTKGEGKGLPQTLSPYTDVYTASLCLIQADKQLGRASERFILVKFDSRLSSEKRLPELFQGLPLFQLPSQSKGLLSELTVGGTGRGSGRRTWRGWRWRPERDQKSLESEPLKHP